MIAPVYLQCEFTARDLDSRLLIAAYLLQQKVPVVIGQWSGIIANVGTSPKGVNVFGTCNQYQTASMKRCIQHGHRVLALDEEILAVQDANEILRSFHSDACSSLDAFGFQDAHHEKVLRSVFPALPGIITGNARIELLRQHSHIYASEAKECQNRGPYVVINTNFSFVNPIWGSVEDTVQRSMRVVPEHAITGKQVIDQFIKNQTIDIETVKSILKVLARERGDRRIIVRPHPNENTEFWSRFDGVEVVMGSNPIPWMLNADLVIHTTSTTGYEAALLGTPCINVGTPDPIYVMGRVNCSIPDADAAADAIVLFLQGKGGPIGTFKSPLQQVVPSGAASIASVAIKLAEKMPEARRINAWGPIPRLEAHIKKLSVPIDLFLNRIKAICSPLVPYKLNVTPLDDSLFLMTP